MRIAVYCGSTPGNDGACLRAASELGAWMGRNGHELLYGGSKTGLMGALADGVLAAGGAVTGVVPNVPSIKARMHPGLTAVVETETMAERKAVMLRAEAWIALPGGLGTLDEITEVLSLRSLDLVRGPVIFYSVNGYYEPLKPVFDNILQRGFGRPAFFSGVVFAACLEEVSQALAGPAEGAAGAETP